MSEWISIEKELPVEQAVRRQLFVTCTKKHPHIDGDPYSGMNIHTVAQCWVVRRWPENFTHWMEIPELPV